MAYIIALVIVVALVRRYTAKPKVQEKPKCNIHSWAYTQSEEGSTDLRLKCRDCGCDPKQ